MDATDAHTPRITVGGAEVGLCLTRLHHDHFTEATAEPDPVRQRLADRGYEFERRTREAVLSAHRGTAVVLDETESDIHTATERALTDGVDLIIGGRIRSPDGFLVGAPDLLVRIDDGYAAVEIKSHKVFTDSGLEVELSDMDDLATRRNEGELRFRPRRKRDLYQVAHYWRVLNTMGYACTTPVGGVIGTDEPPLCAWVDLDADDRSLLAETTDLAQQALKAIEHGASSPTPLVAAWWRGACRSCPWREICHAELSKQGDPTLLMDVGTEERSLLADAGVHSISGIAALDVQNDLVDGSVVLDARAHQAGHLLLRHPTPTAVTVPSAAVEVDFDIETFEGRIYLAGFLITVDGESQFDPIVDWHGTDRSERDLVTSMFARLAHYQDRGAVLLHWTAYERDQLARAARTHGVGVRGYESVLDWFDEHAIDLYQWTKETFVSPAGFGLKAIAPMCGFHWRDQDPGGLQSEIWYAAQLDGDDSMRARLLAYNEDDVRAQLAIRRWARTQLSDPGAGIPSATVARR